MSGHSKWSNIKRKKGVKDQKRGQLFSKLAKMISVAARQGENPESNFKLRLAIDKARHASMPQENIQRAIRRGAGKEKGAVFEEFCYEAFGPSGIALMIVGVTDNKNRTLALLRHIFSEHEGKLAESGSVKWMFEIKGVIRLQIPDEETREKIELAAIDAGAEDIVEENSSLVIYTIPSELIRVKELLISSKAKIESAEIEYIPKDPIVIKDKKVLDKIDKLMEALDELEDVNEIYSNLVS